jgi:hypothetical protein
VVQAPIDRTMQKGSDSCHHSSLFRIELFQNIEDDKFLPHYKFDCKLPEIPVKPKLFTYKIDYKKAAEYEFSSIEINQEQLINVDDNMGMAIDLIDRDIYNFEPFTVKGDNLSAAELHEKMEKLRLELFDEKDLYLLSDSNDWVDPRRSSQHGNNQSSKSAALLPTKLPASHRLVHRKGNWGRHMKDQLAVRAIEETLPEELQPVMTSANKIYKEKFHEKAIAQINRRFDQVDTLKVGMPKGKEHPGVTAVKVIDFMPMMQALGNRFTLTVCDDIIEEELTSVKEPGHPMNNDFLLQELRPEELEESLQDERRSVLYRY